MPDLIAKRQISDKSEKILRFLPVRQKNNYGKNENVNPG
jgi:hypothetical protein